MDRIIDINQTRQERLERQEQFRKAAEDLMNLLEHHRETIPEEFMTFLLSLAISEQAAYYANQANSNEAGYSFLDQLQNTAEQLFNVQLRSLDEAGTRPPLKSCSKSGRIISFLRQKVGQPLD